MKDSVLSMLVKCPICTHLYIPGIEGRNDGKACYVCEHLVDEDTGEVKKDLPK